MRHAYLILAHNEPRILATLVSLIDDERNDVYLHVDKKADIRQFDGIRPAKSGFYLVPRVKVYWGDVSQIKAEYTLLKAAVAHGGYSRYHLISGVDLPLHSQDYIHHICDDVHCDKEFIGCCFGSQLEKITEYSQYRLYFLKFARGTNAILKKSALGLSRVLVGLQKMLRAKRVFPLTLEDGSQWFSITDEFARYALANETQMLRMFRHVKCCDEMLMQTLAINSRFKDRLFLNDKGNADCMREIDWARGKPYVWQITDLDYLRSSKAFFARKFSSKHGDIIAALSSGCGR